MRNVFLLSKFTIREALSRKVILAFSGITTLGLLIITALFLYVSLDDFLPTIKQGGQEVNIFEQIKEIVTGFKMATTMTLFMVCLLFSVISVSSFVPNMLEKGNIDLFLSKPVGRWELILGKFLGGSAIVLANIVYAIFGIWFLIGLKFGIWDLDFFYVVPMIAFTFMVLYSLIIFIGITTKNTIFSLMVIFLLYTTISPLLVAREGLYILVDNIFVEYIVDGLYYIIPKTAELTKMTAELTSGGLLNIAEAASGFDYWQPVVSSFLFMILTLWGSIFIFNKKDY